MQAGEVREVLHINRHGVCHPARLVERKAGGKWRVELLDRSGEPRGGTVTVDADDILAVTGTVQR